MPAMPEATMAVRPNLAYEKLNDQLIKLCREVSKFRFARFVTFFVGTRGCIGVVVKGE